MSTKIKKVKLARMATKSSAGKKKKKAVKGKKLKLSAQSRGKQPPKKLRNVKDQKSYKEFMKWKKGKSIDEVPCKIFLNYDNDKKVYVLPVNPPDLSFTVKGETSSVEVDGFGEVVHKNRRDSGVIKFQTFFPMEWDQFVCSCTKDEFKDPTTWHKWMMSLLNAAKPCHFVVAGISMPVNMYADITNYSAKEVGGDPGTIQFTIEMKESRTPKITVYKNGKKSGASKSRGNNKASTKKYKVKAKSAWFRKKKNGKKLKKLKKGTVVIADGKKKGKWLHVKYGGKWGWMHKSKLKKV